METPKNKGGRPIGSVNALTAEAKRQAAATGRLPHEILLSIARGEPQTIHTLAADGSVVPQTVAIDLDTMKDAAKAAAPYYASKLSSVEMIQGIRDDDLDQLIAELATQAGLAPSSGGEGAADEEAEGARSASGRDARGAPSVRGPRRRVEF